MSSLSAIPDSNPTRAQLRLVVLGQWVQAGLSLARGGTTGRGLVGGAVALWRVFQAIRLAIQLAQRLSELRGVLSFATPKAAPGETAAGGSAPCSDDPAGHAACLRNALIEIARLIRDGLGLAPERRGQSGAHKAATAATEPGVPRAVGRPAPPRGRPPDRPPGAERSRARWRRPCAAPALETALTPIAEPAVGRRRLAAG